MGRILVVDDSEVQLELIAGTLEEGGFKVQRETSGQRAIDRANENSYDVIILDIHMPRTNGLAVLNEIKLGGASFGADVIIVSSDKSSETFNAAKRLGAWDYILKPVNAEELLKKVSLSIRPASSKSASSTKTNSEKKSDRGKSLADRLMKYSERSVEKKETDDSTDESRILVIEDSAVHQKFLVSTLEGAGYKVDAEDNGERGIQQASEQSYGIILLDVHLPRTNGLVALHEIKEQGESKDANVLIVSSDTKKETFRAAKRLGASDYLVKPVTAEHLLSKVSFWLDHELGGANKDGGKKPAKLNVTAGSADADSDRKIKILIVDDSKIQQALLLGILDDDEFDINLAKDGEEAIEYAEAIPHDMILLDIHLPKKNGLEVLKSIKKGGTSKDSHVIIITSNANTDTIKAAITGGACDYIVKPVSAPQLLGKIHKWVG